MNIKNILSFIKLQGSNRRYNSYGFTLIELLVVVAIIGVLVTIVIVAINPAKLINDANDSRMRADLNQIKASMQLYYNDCKAYPTVADYALYTGKLWNGTSDAIGACSANATIYMKQLPEDPNGDPYLYAVTPVNCDNNPAGVGLCTDYIAGAVLHNPASGTGADGLTVTKCGALGAASFEVCND